MTKRIGIVGGGPAGGFLALQLAKAGLPVTIFDDSHPREKPCGGVLSEGTLVLMPPTGLKSANPLTHLRFRTPFGREFTVKHPRRQVSISRAEYDLYILNQAIAAGANHVARRVLDATAVGEGWQLTTKDGEVHHFDVVCGADGVRSIVARAVGGLLGTPDLGFTQGFFSNSLPKKQEILVRFGNHVGYSWIIQRADHASVGIGGPMLARQKLLQQFKNFLVENKLVEAYEQSDRKYSWMIPFARSEARLDDKRAGKNWLLVGDAAGFCDPLTGEGIHLALESALLAARAIVEGDLALYETLWRAQFGSQFRYGIVNRRLLASPPMAEVLLDNMRTNPAAGLSFFKLL